VDCVVLTGLCGAGFQVRHPNILSFLHSAEIETYDAGSPKVTIYIVTEPVMPLSEKIKELGLEGTQRYQLSYCCFLSVRVIVCVECYSVFG